jgi:hypothetical protein
MALHTAAHGSAVAGSSTLLPSDSRVHVFFSSLNCSSGNCSRGPARLSASFQNLSSCTQQIQLQVLQTPMHADFHSVGRHHGSRMQL